MNDRVTIAQLNKPIVPPEFSVGRLASKFGYTNEVRALRPGLNQLPKLIRNARSLNIRVDARPTRLRLPSRRS